MKKMLRHYRNVGTALLAVAMATAAVACGYFSDKFEETLNPPAKETVPTAIIADANRSVLINSTVILDGTHSHDPQQEALTFTWSLAERPNGSAATLSNTNEAVTSFVADVGGTFVATLTVTNDSNVASRPVPAYIDAVNTTPNHPPVAIAGADQTVTVADVVVLDGSTSYDEDGDALQYSWAVVSAPPASNHVLNGQNKPKAYLYPDVTGTFTVNLWVSDGIDADEDIIVITVN